MGTAGLNVERLAGLLERKKVECTLIEGDAALDHCVLRLASRRRPALVAFVEYENQGIEPRLVGLSVQENEPANEKEDRTRDWQKKLKLQGARENILIRSLNGSTASLSIPPANKLLQPTRNQQVSYSRGSQCAAEQQRWVAYPFSQWKSNK